jgi:hypothetical protein
MITGVDFGCSHERGLASLRLCLRCAGACGAIRGHPRREPTLVSSTVEAFIWHTLRVRRAGARIVQSPLVHDRCWKNADAIARPPRRFAARDYHDRDRRAVSELTQSVRANHSRSHAEAYETVNTPCPSIEAFRPQNSSSVIARARSRSRVFAQVRRPSSSKNAA